MMAKLMYVLQHAAVSFGIAFLLAIQGGVAVKVALLGALAITLRDLKSLWDKSPSLITGSGKPVPPPAP